MKKTVSKKKAFVGANVSKEQKRALADLKSRTGKTYAALLREAVLNTYGI